MSYHKTKLIFIRRVFKIMGFCNNCNQEVSTKFCPNCGKEVTETIKSTKNDTPATKSNNAEPLSLVDELYVFRAGLSRVSQEYDKFKNITRYESSSIIIKNRKLNEIANKYKQRNFDKSVEKEKLQKDLDKAKDNFVGFLLLLIACISVCLFCLTLFILICCKDRIVEGPAASLLNFFIGGEYNGELDNPFRNLGSMFWGALSFVGTIFLGFLSFGLTANLSEPRNLEQNIEKISREIKSEEEVQEIINADEEYIMLSEEIKKIKEANNASNEQKKLCIDFYREFYSFFLLDFDKKYNFSTNKLDNIIYLLETKRASDLKDALLQSSHANPESVAEHISKAIPNNPERLNNAIENYVKSIVVDGNLIESFEKHVDVAEIQNALLKKADVSSKELSDDLCTVERITISG